MKSVIIAGTSRAGKTTLARRVHQAAGLYWIKGDALVGALGDTFPQLNVRHGGDYKTVSDGFAPFAVSYLTRSKNTPLIFDSYFLTPDQVMQYNLHENYIVHFLGYPNADRDEKLTKILECDPHFYGPELEPLQAWSDEVSRKISMSRDIEKKCAEFGLNFTDTSHDFAAAQDQAFAKIMADITP